MIENLSSQTIGFIVLAILYFVFRVLNATDTPKIKNLPEIPGIPIFGNLLQLGESHAKVAASWVKKYGPVFQVRLGNRRIVFANSFDSVRHLWITNQSSLISRPTLYTFHNVVSSSQGFTIGTSPWDESCKARRKAAASALNRPAVQSYMPIIDLESCLAIKDLAQDGVGGAVDIDPRKYFHRFALNTSLTLNYGIRIDGGIDQELLREGETCLTTGNEKTLTDDFQLSGLSELFPTLEAHPTTGRTTSHCYASPSFLAKTRKHRNTVTAATNTLLPSSTC